MPHSAREPNLARHEALLSHTIVVTAFGRAIRLLDLPWPICVKRVAGRLEVIAELEALAGEIRGQH